MATVAALAVPAAAAVNVLEVEAGASGPAETVVARTAVQEEDAVGAVASDPFVGDWLAVAQAFAVALDSFPWDVEALAFGAACETLAASALATADTGLGYSGHSHD